jgi:hypothetical protein
VNGGTIGLPDVRVRYAAALRAIPADLAPPAAASPPSTLAPAPAVPARSPWASFLSLFSRSWTMLNTALTFAAARLREPSTWAGLAALMTAVGQAIASKDVTPLIPAVIGFVAIVRKGWSMTAILAVLSGGWARLAAGAAAVAALLAGLFAVRQSGVHAQQLRDLKQTEIAYAKADDARAAVDRANDAAVDRELREQFSRR